MRILKQFINNLLATDEQERHEEVLRKYTLPKRASMPKISSRRVT